MHLRIRKKTGLFFLLRPYLRRRGLWAVLLLFVPLLLWSQGLVWAVDASGLTVGEYALPVMLVLDADDPDTLTWTADPAKASVTLLTK